ncbi:MAG TPA: UDP-N-acetylmuramoyl-tripeptide--D-alanyl-D-alanine ligase [Flavobacterium lutivivi]|nr:UDP-N-acetylmuramoyl-tripeptide--D-alanyl-D-alanine ligase [Flavobacterium lutivivi]
MNIENLHRLFLECSSVSTDTRRIEKDCMFFALKGANFDANEFAKQALQNGAKYVVIDNSNFYIDENSILVEDVLSTLQELSTFHRDFLALPILALTGSNGKTTTKELINVVLSRKFKTKATKGNLNNHIGVPLTLLSFDKETEIGIVEMGANHQKEIEFLCAIAKPDFGYITNFGKAHLEGFGGVEGVIKGKSEMYDYLYKFQKTAFVNFDDKLQVEKTKNIKRFIFSQTMSDADVFIQSATANPFVEIKISDIQINSNLIGIYNANNINAAITIGKYFGVDDFQIKEAIESYTPENNRSQIIKKGNNEIILDAYNANPSSMAVAIENFLNLKSDNKVIIIGDMFELGESSIAEHDKIISMLVDFANVDCYFVGKDFFLNKKEYDHFHFFKTFEDLSKQLVDNNFSNALILIKGSRGMALERVLDFIK